MAVENRLSAEQLAGLVPGDAVCIEKGGDFRRPKLATGTVVRVEGSRLVVSTRGAQGGIYVEHYSRRDGIRAGGGRRAELVNGEAGVTGLPDEQRRALRVDAAYRAWARNKGDLEKLRELRVAVSDALDAAGLCV
jgi:hypothetical protein